MFELLNSSKTPRGQRLRGYGAGNNFLLDTSATTCDILSKFDTRTRVTIADNVHYPDQIQGEGLSSNLRVNNSITDNSVTTWDILSKLNTRIAR